MSIVMPDSIRLGRECSQPKHDPAFGACAGCAVRELSVCGVLVPAEINEFEKLSRSTDFEARSTLFTEDEPATQIFNITQGVVRLYKLLRDGRRQIVGFALPGDFLGLALQDDYSVSADAVTQVTACRFQRNAFTQFLDVHPLMMRRLHEMASHELSLAQDQMVLLGRHNADERLALFLLALSERYIRIGESGVNVQLPMSRQDIADYLGLTIETVSRTFSRLAKAKLIVVVPDGVRLLETEGLRQLANG